MPCAGSGGHIELKAQEKKYLNVVFMRNISIGVLQHNAKSKKTATAPLARSHRLLLLPLTNFIFK